MAAAPSKEVTNKQVCSVAFSFYSDDEVKKLSVKRITSPFIFNSQGQPHENGLYDRALGPLEGREKCASCGLKLEQCPGHFGHIELPVPVFNPLTFSTLYKLLRSMCQRCFRFKLAEDQVEVFQKKLELLKAGRLQEALSVVGAKGKGGEDGSEDSGEDSRDVGTKGQGRKPAPKRSDVQSGGDSESFLTCSVMEALRETTGSLFSHMPAVTCQNCGACNPSIKRQPGQKLFKIWKSGRHLTINASKDRVIKNVLDIPTADVAVEYDAEQQQRGRKRRHGADGDHDDEAEEAKGYKEDDDKGSMDDDNEEDEKDDEKDDEDADEDEDEDEKADEKEAAGKKEELGVAALAKRARTGGATAPEAEEERDLSPQYMTAMEAEALLKRLWEQESAVLCMLYAGEAGTAQRAQRPTDGYHIFFLRSLPVTPNRFRPASKLGDEKFEHPQNVLLQRILNACLDLHTPQQQRQQQQQQQTSAVAAKDVAAIQLDISIATILRLQNLVAALMDSSTAEATDVKGIRQQLERKEGLFRMYMMGKRVNFAARSVISPDPYIGTGEIGVPPYFAKRLSFPERVTPWNVGWLRELVVRGPDTHPGALAVEDELGRLVNLHHCNKQRREALAKQLLSGYASGKVGGSAAALQSAAARQLPGGSGSKIVYRHLMDGDIMLTNRQPTLHKPGLMAHRARVLKGERTIRMHYANCATFNADFDGDEINLHLPQDHHGRAEGYGIVHSDEQYIVPTDGKPIRGLIQDHVVSGVLLTKKDAFLTRQQFMQLLLVACTDSKLGSAKRDVHFDIPTPAILRPVPLWTGKQLLSALLRHLTRGLPPLSMERDGKVPADYWGPSNGEGALVFYKGDLVAGTMDKNQYGKFGLVHAVQELYGCQAAGHLLSAFSRLFTYYLQWHGFTCGLDDLLLQESAEAQRLRILTTAEAKALAASANFANQPLQEEIVKNPGQHGDELQAASRRLAVALGERYRSDRATGLGHDKATTSVMHPLSSEVVKVCLPRGQVKPFPANCLSLMTITGAKGSLVNFSQISCLLGQQELEGRRVPRMASGKTLPCFRPYDAGARSGGFVGDRFLTGLRPQEYYFHCMAGREGLVDTAVKTSRSGYLQRCMVKNLETLRVTYDCSVRDSSDGSVVQFYYGEDGLDVTTVSYLDQFAFLAKNGERFAQQLALGAARETGASPQLAEQEEQLQQATKHRQKLLRKGGKGPARAAESLPYMATLPPSVLGATSEAFADRLGSYLEANPDRLLARRKDIKKGLAAKGAFAAEDFSALMSLKYMRCLAAPGEAVGVLAGQSIGEPSTQMTLNTFHMAGRGEANVTLGIPRLREILMTAAKSIKTPVMTLPLQKGLGQEEAAALANSMRRIRLAECLDDLTVAEAPVGKLKGLPDDYARVYTITLRFFDLDLLPKELKLEFKHLEECFRAFCEKLKAEVTREVKRAGGVGISVMALSAADADEGGAAATQRGSGGDDEDGDGEAGGSQRGRGKSAKAGEAVEDEEDEAGEEDEENEELREGKLRFRGEAAAQEEDEDRDDGDGDGDGQDDGEDEPTEGDLEAIAEADEENPEQAKGAASKGKRGKGAGKRKPKPQGGDGDVQLEVLVDRANNSCSTRVVLPLSAPKILMLEVVERVAASTMLRATPGIDKCYVVQGKNGAAPFVQTDGLNFQAAWDASELVATSGITTNDVSAMLRTYGVEAARATIVAEVSAVFNAYGIAVDRRHLSLIADFMTHQGGYRPCNRLGIDTSPSPLLKMSFETAGAFLLDATLKGERDPLKTPASRIVVGRVVELGTGMVQLVQQI